MAKEQKTLSDVTEQLEETNRSNYEIERHTRNSRRHLLHIKKVTDSINTSMTGISGTLDSIYEVMTEGKTFERENRMESIRRQNNLVKAVEKLGKSKTSTAIAKKDKDGNSSGSGAAVGLSALLGRAGKGMALAGVGIGAVLAGGGYLIQQLGELDGAAVRKNIVELMKIPDEVSGSSWDFFKDSAAFTASMAGLGAGLAAFAVGGGLANALAYFETPDWASTIRDNVSELLKINQDHGGGMNFVNMGSGFGLAMSAISVGLALFGIGGSLAVALDRFGKPGWGGRIRDNAKALLDINDHAVAGDGSEFVAVMGSLSAGLIAFAFGEGAAALSGKFSAPGWADTIKSNVKTLLSIADEVEGKKTALEQGGTFAGMMAGLGGGLALFGIGQTFTALGRTFSDDSWASDIKSNVSELLTITDLFGTEQEDKTKKFTDGMQAISSGLRAFAGATFLGSLADAAEKIMEFFGANNAFDEVMDIADNSSKLMRGATAIERIADALERFGNIDVNVSDIDFEGLAENLGRSIPLLQKLSSGGVYDPGFLQGDIDFGKGLLDPSLRLDDLANKMSQVHRVLGISRGTPTLGQASGEVVTATGNGASGGNDGAVPMGGPARDTPNQAIATNQDNSINVNFGAGQGHQDRSLSDMYTGSRRY